MPGYTYKGTQNVDQDPTKHKDCGTDKGYQRHRRRKEQACIPCLAAHTEAEARREGRTPTGRRRRPGPECGTRHGYVHHFTHGDRKPCLPCRLANAEKCREYRARKKEAA